MPCRLVLLSIIPAAAAAESTICLPSGRDCLSQPPALLQTRRVLEAAAVAASTYSERAYQNYELLKELRRHGFTCPGGKHFPPNSAELHFDCRLWKAAQKHSEDMGARNYFSHVSPDGSDPMDRSSAEGFGTFSENIAAGEADAGKTLEQWKKSDGHCTNMMDAGHSYMAVGYANVGSSTYKHYWTSLFGSGGGATDTSCYPQGGAGGAAPAPAPAPAQAPAPGAGGAGGRRGCSDTDEHCQHYSSLGYCDEGSEYGSWMAETCKMTCGKC